MARYAGVLPFSEAAVCLVAQQTLLDQGWIGREETVALFDAGTDLKYPHLFEDARTRSASQRHPVKDALGASGGSRPTQRPRRVILSGMPASAVPARLYYAQILAREQPGRSCAGRWRAPAIACTRRNDAQHPAPGLTRGRPRSAARQAHCLAAL